jgi:ketosteroid isomerase-like protein
MSQENVEIVRHGFEAFQRGDLDGALAILAPDVEWKQMEEPETARGPSAVLEALGRWTDMWIDPEVSPQEWRAAADSVVVRVKWTGRSKGTGIRVEQYAYNVFDLRDGKVVQMREYGADSRVEAVEAAGLSE